jgi:uncharacterized protein YceH (UPF0502 family)
VLLLRGPQTPGELKARIERMASLNSLAEVERVLAVLGERGYARRLERRPGQKEDRFEHLMGGRDYGAPGAGAPAGQAPVAGHIALTERPAPAVTAAHTETAPETDQAMAAPDAARLHARIEALEAEVASLREELAALRGERQLDSAGPTI